MQAPRYSPPQGSFSMRLDNRALVAVLLTFWHRPHYLKYHQSCTPYYCQSQTQNLAAYHLLTPTLWYPNPAGIYERHCESSIFLGNLSL